MAQDYTAKYKLNKPVGEYPGKRGRKYTPTTWEQDRHYGYKKHQAQARFRKEEYELTEQAWNDIWTHDCWHRKGRGKHDLTLYRVDASEPWHQDNVVLVEQQHKGKYYQPDRTPGGRPRKSK